MINPVFLTDSYKLSHIKFETVGTTKIYSNFTPRFTKYFKDLYPDFDNKIVWFGLQGVIQKILCETWSLGFFHKEWNQIEQELKEVLTPYIGLDAFSHFEALHKLGFLPIHIKALPEGSLTQPGIPCFTITNTLPEFSWLPNYLETIISSELWKPMTVATVGRQFRSLTNRLALETTGSTEGTQFQLHDFSFRGQAGWESSAANGAGFLLSTLGTDNIPAILYLKKYYGAVHTDQQPIAFSVSGSEHSVATLGILSNHTEDREAGEKAFLKDVITNKFPSGLVSYVADSYDYWNVLTDILPALKEEILARDGTLVIRPDSGDPVDVVCGTLQSFHGVTPEEKGSIQLLWETFGGTVNEQGYKVLNPKIGLIYGDGITYDRAACILEGLRQKGFASTNVVFGIGSFSLSSGGLSRDSLGSAIKATYAEVNGNPLALCKEPKTDLSKKSARGLLKVTYNQETDLYELQDNCTVEEEKEGLLQTVFLNGVVSNTTTLAELRDKLV